MENAMITQISEDQVDEYTCTCGSQASFDGFASVIVVAPNEYLEVKPTPELWAGVYACNKCGRLHEIIPEVHDE
jgi:hypothetical protein